jgi:hypothetical protein
MTPPADVGLLMRLHQRRAQVLVSLARYGEAIADCERMLELARGFGDRHGEGEALLEAALSHWLTFTWEGAGRTQRYAEEALALARETGDQLVLARSLTYLGLVDQIHGRLVDGEIAA